MIQREKEREGRHEITDNVRNEKITKRIYTNKEDLQKNRFPESKILKE